MSHCLFFLFPFSFFLFFFSLTKNFQKFLQTTNAQNSLIRCSIEAYKVLLESSLREEHFERWIVVGNSRSWPKNYQEILVFMGLFGFLFSSLFWRNGHQHRAREGSNCWNGGGGAAPPLFVAGIYAASVVIPLLLTAVARRRRPPKLKLSSGFCRGCRG